MRDSRSTTRATTASGRPAVSKPGPAVFPSNGGRRTLTDITADETGKRVVNGNGEEIGVVLEVDADESTADVEPDEPIRLRDEY
ncbi:hypothetical protein [Halopiger aswanensis]|uniref:Uncharacterized protein n=1 Tax=Halopiger aswanensis TaxID=148449 RepID=A0A3R7DY20_9EURY|nr:hypothetical protein [Halopiger aswanensis]RKD93606.1 hypothetical protein ATJ93_3236 [Halopiger aswanensis]